jgi:uncharacterized repeat protein (TIGR02543 family)
MKRFVVFLAGVVCILLASCNDIFYTLASSGNEPDTGEYIVRFDKNGGDTEAYPQTIIVKPPASTVMLPSIEPQREGYLFTGWNTEKDGSGAEFTKDTLVKANITVYAQWLYLPDGSFIVHFDKNNTDANSQEANPQNKAIIPPSDTITGALPAEPTRTGYDFTGWNTERDGTGTLFDENTTVTENITVYAQWKAYECEVIFDKNHDDDEGTFTEAYPQTITVTYPATRVDEISTPPTRDRYDFTEWNIKADGTGEKFTAGTPVGILENKTLTVYAQWAEKTYTISGTIYRSGGEGASGAMVSLSRDGNLVDTTWADANGAYAFSGVLARPNYTIRATLDRHMPETTESFSVNWEDTTAPDLTLIRLWVISGTVKEVSAFETNGSPVAYALLEVTQPGRPDQFVYTNSAGYYELDVYTGECHITVSCQSYVTEETSINVSGDIEDNNFTLRLITFSVSGTVTLLDDGSGNVENVQLQLIGNGTYETTPQANGSYNFPTVRVDYYSIYASLSGYEGDYDSFNITNADVSNINLILKKLWTVTFQSDGGNPIPSNQTVAHNDTAYRPANPSQLGYNFVNWYSDPSLTTVYNFTTPVTGNITLYAKWEMIPTFTVSYNANGATSGSAPSAQTVNAGTIISLHGANGLLKTGHNFSGWNTQSDGNGTNYNAGASYTVNDNITFYAKWTAIPQYTVSFDINGGSGTTPPSQTVYESENITLPSGTGITKTGYTFGGWNTNNVGTGTNYSAGSSFTPSGNITLYAKWNEIPRYTITFNINNGSGTTPEPQTVYAGESVTLPGQGDLSRTGYIFGGWNTASNGGGTNYDAGASYVVNGSGTLYAKWNPITYTVRYDANGGIGTMANQTFTYGVSQSLRSNTFTNDSYIFEGWARSEEGPVEYTNGQSVSNLATTQGAVVTLYAKWNAIPQHTISFDINNGSGTTPASQTVNAGTSITLPDDDGFSKDGYTFGGWNTSAAGTGTNYSAGSSFTPSGNITLYAKWNEIPRYTITFNINNGSGTTPPSQTVYAGESVTLPGQGDLSRTGYTFGGWNTNSAGTGTNYDAGASYTVNGTRILYAKWDATGTNPPSGKVILSDGNTNYQDVLVQLYTVDWFSQDLVPLGSPIKPDANGEFSIPHVSEPIYFITASLDGYLTAAEPITSATQFPIILTLYLETSQTSQTSQSINLQQLLLQLNN